MEINLGSEKKCEKYGSWIFYKKKELYIIKNLWGNPKPMPGKKS